MIRFTAVPRIVALALLAFAASARADGGANSPLPAPARPAEGAKPGPGAPPASDRALFDLIVNEVPQDTVLVLLAGDGDAFVPVEELTKAGLSGLAGQRQTRDGVEFVSLRSLAPVVSFQLDVDKLTVRVTAQPRLFGTRELDLRAASRPSDVLLRRDRSAFLNYSVSGTTGVGFSGAGELGATVGPAFAFTSANVQPGGGVVRGTSQVLLDDPDRLRRVTLGDGFVGSTPLGGADLLAGVAVSREFSLDPYFVRAPLPRMQGAILTPSRLDVYANGVLIRSQDVAPGTFDVRNVPVTTGAGNISYVVRDAFGRTQEFSAPYYASQGLLAAGLSDYTYAFGARRREFGVRSFTYDPPGFLAAHRLGLSDRLTLGYRFEGALQHVTGWDAPSGSCCANLVASGGPSATVGLPLGELTAEVAASADGVRTGTAAQLAYSLLFSRFSVGASARALSRFYSNLSLGASGDRPRLSVAAYAGVSPIRRLSLSLDGAVTSLRDGGLTTSAGARAEAQLLPSTQLSAAVVRMRTPVEGTLWSFSVSLLYTFGNQTYARVSSNAQKAGVGENASVQKSAPVGTGLGYQLLAQRDANGTESGQGLLQAQGDHAVVLGQYTRFASADTGVATVAGALTLVGGEWYASRPVHQGYALLQVPGVEGVRGYLNNQEIGRTDGRGDLLIPDLQAYYGNHISISPQDVPMDYQIGAPSQTVATGYRGGVLVRFDVHRLRIVSGKLVVAEEGKSAIPSYGEMTVQVSGDHRAVSPVGPTGEFYLENVQPGRYAASVEFRAGICRFDLDVPASNAPAIDVGSVVCSRVEHSATASQ